METIFALSSNTYVNVAKSAALVKRLNSIDKMVGRIIAYLTIFKFLILKINAKPTSATKHSISSGWAVLSMAKLMIK